MTIVFLQNFCMGKHTIMKSPETLQLLCDLFHICAETDHNHHLKAGSAKHYTAFFIWLLFVAHIQAAVTSKSCRYSKREVCKSSNKILKKLMF